MKRKLTIVLLGSVLVLASVAAAATSPPTGGGHYKGTDNSTAARPTVALVVTKDGKEFKSGRINFVLLGQGGLGSCAGGAYVTVSPTSTRQISATGTFNIHGSFKFSIKTPYGPETYAATARIKGSFSNAGKSVSGTVHETAVGKGLTCHSGAVKFTANLV